MPATRTLLWHRPAERFEEASPVGNGALGGIVYGDTEGRIGLNDSTVWSGTPSGPGDALAAVLAAGAGPGLLAEVRAAVDAGDHDRAEDLLMRFEGPWSQEFLPLGDLRVGVEGAVDAGSYSRELDLLHAAVSERFTVDGVPVRRTVWADAAAGALIVLLESERGLRHRVSLASRLPGEVRRAGSELRAEFELPVDGAPAHEPDAVAHRWDADAARATGFDPVAAVAVVRTGDGDDVADADGVAVAGATRTLVALTCETNGRRWWQGRPTVGREILAADAAARARAAVASDPQDLLAAHRALAAGALGASALDLGTASRIDMAELLESGDDRAMASTMYAFGRYLLWSSSRAGSPPANLQGIWNASMRPAWSSNYTININTEMNYWAAERTGLAVVHEPLIELVSRLAETGSAVASQLYGTRGWVAHHNTDPWGYALPAGAGHGAASWAFWPMGGLWLTEHVWQHWRHGLDRAFLEQRAWPILRGAAEFALDWLVDAPDGALRTIPSTSPENGFVAEDGSSRAVTESSAMDIALIRSTLEHARDAARALGAGADLVGEIDGALGRLPAPAVTPAGLLREWSDDRTATDPHHRHLSHLIRLFPLEQIDAVRTPELARAARRSLDDRGPGAMGWSWAWKVAARARLGDGDVALDLFREATRPLDRDPDVDAPADGSEWGGLLPNLFSTHPPFQIDGNLGFPAALAELLVGPGSDPLRLLPALPRDWPDGAVTGIRVDGGLSVDLEWRNARPTVVRIERRSPAAPRRVRVVGPEGERSEELPETGPLVLELAGAER